jgi:hypothetical protein
MKIPVDRNVERLSVTHVTELVPQTVNWGPHSCAFDVARQSYRPPREDETFYKEELPYLASLCDSAREGKVEFFTSFELSMEAVRQKGSSQGYLGINLLQGVPVKKVSCPEQRSVMFGAATSVGITEDEQMEFFRSPRTPRFLRLKKALGEAHIDDAFHLWTAEEASLDVLLTMDRRFRNVVTNEKRRVSSLVSVMTPRELSEHLDLEPTDIETLAEAHNPFS